YFHVTGVQTCALPIFGAPYTMMATALSGKEVMAVQKGMYINGGDKGAIPFSKFQIDVKLVERTLYIVGAITVPKSKTTIGTILPFFNNISFLGVESTYTYISCCPHTTIVSRIEGIHFCPFTSRHTSLTVYGINK